MRIVQVVLALLLCLYVAQDWHAGDPAFTVIPDLDVPFWFAIPLAAICATGSIADLLQHRPLRRQSSLHRGQPKRQQTRI